MYQIPTMMKKKRTELGMSQDAMADHVGVHSRTYQAWERDKCVPKSEMFPMICKLLGVSLLTLEKMCEQEKLRRKSDAKSNTRVN